MLQLYEYELPFRFPFRAGPFVLKKRKGVLLHFRNSEIDIPAEAAPLPGFSLETFADVKQILLDQKKNIEEFLNEEFTLQAIRNLDNNINNDLNLPSVQFALSFLALSVFAERKGKTIYDPFKAIPAESIQINDVIGHSSPREMEKQIEKSVSKGFKTIKIKALHPVGELASLLARMQKKYPSIQFRLDANQSWPVSSLQKNCDFFENIRVQYIEEPVLTESLDDIQKLQKNCSIPVALDESISGISKLEKTLSGFPDVYVIIKPTLLGNILKIHETISQFRGSLKRIVCTTALEASIGRSMVATTAFLMGDSNMSHGLNTGHLFSTDLLPDLEIKNGLLKNHQYNPGNRSFQNIRTSHIKKLG